MVKYKWINSQILLQDTGCVHLLSKSNDDTPRSNISDPISLLLSFTCSSSYHVHYMDFQKKDSSWGSSSHSINMIRGCFSGASCEVIKYVYSNWPEQSILWLDFDWSTDHKWLKVQNVFHTKNRFFAIQLFIAVINALSYSPIYTTIILIFLSPIIITFNFQDLSSQTKSTAE